METLNQELANYIITYFGELLTVQEKAALKHQHSLIKLEGDENEQRTKLYYRQGWLSKDAEVLDLLSAGPDHFLIKCAGRILKERPDKVYLNFCPKCNKLARTPEAKQCRYCHYDWH
jgi:hypothetical protein